MSNKTWGLIEGGVWIGLGTALCGGASRIGLGNLYQPGSGALSFLAGLLLVFLGFMLLLGQILERGSNARELEEATGSPRKGLYSLAGLVVYASFLNILGFRIATFLLLCFLFKILSPRQWLSPVLISFLTVLLSYVVFHLWLKLDLPKGILLGG